MKKEGSIIRGKKILFFAPSFFGYEYKIKSKLEDMDATVDYYDVRSIKSAKARAWLKIFPNAFTRRTRKYYHEILESNHDKDYDYVFIVKCDMITTSILQQMKDTYKNARFCLYLWDSVSNIPGISKKFRYFDKIMSFDRIDSNNYEEIFFRPLFYLDEYRRDDNVYDSEDKEIDISFLGTIHSDRYAIIKKVNMICKQNNLIFYTFKYLQSKFVYYIFKALKTEFRDTKIDDFSFKKMDVKEISRIVSKTKAILDIEHPNQTGLTMRTLEMIGMKKKIITTNKDIVNYDFYNPNNILVLSRDNIQIPKHFIDSEYEALDSLIYDKYSIESWINEILS